MFEHIDLIKGEKLFNEEICTIKSKHGHDLYCKHFIPTIGLKNVKYHIFFLHGAIEHSGRHVAIFNYLKNRYRDEIVISTYDHAGHGKSTGVRASIEDFSILSEDFVEFVNQSNYLEEVPQSIMRIVIAHSMGGLVVLDAIFQMKKNFRKSFHGFIFSNPCIKPVVNPPKFAINLVESIPDSLQKFRIPIIHSGIGLTSDIEKAIEFDTDPLISKFMGIKLALEINSAAKRVRSYSYYLDKPCLFLLSDEDYICDAEMTKLFLAGAPKDLITSIEYNKCKHELFNEEIRDIVFQDISKWISERSNDE